MPNFQIGVNFTGNLGNLPGQAAQAAAGLGQVGASAQTASAALQRLPPATAPAGRGLGQVGRDAAGAAAGLASLPPAAGPAARGLNATTAAANQTAAALARTRAQSGNASVALTDFSRVVQDAPFGFVAIGNNITQLVTSFGDLRRNAGSTGAAFRQLFSSAGGFGGVGLAISLITTAVTLATVGFGAWTRGLSSNKKAVDEAKKATEEFVSSLKTVDSIVGQATGGVQGQIAKVQALGAVVADTNVAYEKRKRALQELSQINKSYFGDLKLEEGQLSTLTARVNEYTKALVQQAVIKGFENEIGKIATGLYDQEKALKVTENAYKRLRTQLEKTRQTETSATGEDRVSQRYISIKNSTDAARKAFEEQRTVVEKGRSKFVELQGSLNGIVKASLDLRDTTTDTTKARSKEDEVLKSLRKELSGYEKQLANINQLRSKGALPINDESKALETQLKIFDTLNKIDAREVAIKTKPELEIDPSVLDLQIKEAYDEFAARVASGPFVKPIPLVTRVTFSDGSTENLFSPADLLGPDVIKPEAFDGVINEIKKNAKLKIDGLGETMRDGLVDTVSKSLADGLVQAADVLGASLGDIFSGSLGEGLANAASGLLGIVGGILQEVGKYIVVTSGLVAALKRALDGLFGPGGEIIAAGVGLALIGLGGVLKNIKIPAFADGVTNFAGGLALVGERGPEYVRLPSGSDVIPNHQLGSFGQEVILQPSIKFSGSYFQVMLERVNKSKSNLG